MLTWRREIPFVGFKCLLYYIYIYTNISTITTKRTLVGGFNPSEKHISPIISLHICIFHKDLWIKHYHLSLNFFTNISANLKGFAIFSPMFPCGIKDVGEILAFIMLPWNLSCHVSCFYTFWKNEKTEGHFKSEKNISKSSTLSPASLRISQHTPRIWTPNRFCFKHPTTRDATPTSHAPMIWEAPTNDGTQLTDSFRSLCWMFLGKPS